MFIEDQALIKSGAFDTRSSGTDAPGVRREKAFAKVAIGVAFILSNSNSSAWRWDVQVSSPTLNLGR